MSSTLADPYRGYSVTYSPPGKPDDDLINYEAAQSQPREKMLSGMPYHDDASASPFGSHLQGVLPLPEPQSNGTHEPQSFAPVHQLLHPPHYNYDLSFPPESRKRARSGSEGDSSRDMDRNIGIPQPVHPMPMDGSSGPDSDILFPIHSDHPSSHVSASHAFPSPLSLSLPLPVPQQHHHHRLPPHSGLHATHPGHGSSSPPPLSQPSVVGQLGMPEPAPRPKNPKTKFMADEDALLVQLKEDKNLTWRQIADFFPGRTSGTLQVRYCTKLKAKDVVWTDDMVRSFFILIMCNLCGT